MAQITKLQAITFTSDDQVSFLNTVLPLLNLKIPVIAIGNDNVELAKSLGCKVYTGGKTFGRKLLIGLQKAQSEFFLFIHPSISLVDLSFLKKATDILTSSLSTGFVVPGLDKSTGPQGFKTRDEAGPLLKISPQCFIYRTKEALNLLEPIVSTKCQTQNCVHLATLQLLEGGILSYVIPECTTTTNFKFKETPFTYLDVASPKLSPRLYYMYRKSPEIPMNAAKLFSPDQIFSYKVTELPTIPESSLVFFLKEGDDFHELMTKDWIQRLCNSPDPFIVGYEFPITSVWSDNTSSFSLGSEVTWEVRAFKKMGDLSKRILVNPYYGEQLPREGLRPVGSPIVHKVSSIPNGITTLIPFNLPILTIATMMKDEERNLTSYLGAACTFANEVVLVDTGSIDKSRDFAKHSGVRLFEHELIDDFSAPRNVYLKEARGDWLLQQDIDELINYKDLYTLLIQIPQGVDAVQFKVHNLTPEKGVIIYQDAIRLFKDPNTWKYTGRVHETVEETAALRNVVTTQKPIIFHLGFLSPKMKEKLLTYRKLIKQQLNENPNDCRPYFNLALDLLNDSEEKPENIDKAATLLQKAVELNPTFTLAWYEIVRVYGVKMLEAISHLITVIPEGHPIESQVEEVLTVLNKFTKRYVFK